MSDRKEYYIEEVHREVVQARIGPFTKDDAAAHIVALGFPKSRTASPYRLVIPLFRGCVMRTFGEIDVTDKEE